jgi:hypothetical protein
MLGERNAARAQADDLRRKLFDAQTENARLVAEADARWPWYVWAAIGAGLTLATGAGLALAF